MQEGRDGSKGAWTGWRGEAEQTSKRATRPSARCCTLAGAIPNIKAGWAGYGLKAALRSLGGAGGVRLDRTQH